MSGYNHPEWVGMLRFRQVPAHVEMMGFLGMGNNPMVGATVAIAVALDLALNKK